MITMKQARRACPKVTAVHKFVKLEVHEDGSKTVTNELVTPAKPQKPFRQWAREQYRNQTDLSPKLRRIVGKA